MRVRFHPPKLLSLIEGIENVGESWNYLMRARIALVIMEVAIPILITGIVLLFFNTSTPF